MSDLDGRRTAGKVVPLIVQFRVDNLEISVIYEQKFYLVSLHLQVIVGTVVMMLML